MVKEINASGANYVNFLGANSIESAGFSSLVFYLDGDDSKGELDLPKLVDTLGILAKSPIYDTFSLQINETSDASGREAIVLHVPTAFAVDELGIAINSDGYGETKKFIGSEVGKEKEVKNEVSPQEDLYNGKRFYVNAWRAGEPGNNIEFLAIIDADGPEGVEERAKAIAAGMIINSTQIEITYVPLSKESFRKQAVRMHAAGKRLPEDVKFSDPAINEHISRSSSARKLKRDYR